MSDVRNREIFAAVHYSRYNCGSWYLSAHLSSSSSPLHTPPPPPRPPPRRPRPPPPRAAPAAGATRASGRARTKPATTYGSAVRARPSPVGPRAGGEDDVPEQTVPIWVSCSANQRDDGIQQVVGDAIEQPSARAATSASRRQARRVAVGMSARGRPAPRAATRGNGRSTPDEEIEAAGFLPDLDARQQKFE